MTFGWILFTVGMVLAVLVAAVLPSVANRIRR